MNIILLILKFNAWTKLIETNFLMFPTYYNFFIVYLLVIISYVKSNKIQ